MLQSKRLSSAAFARREARLKEKFKTVAHKVIVQNRKQAAERAIKRMEQKNGTAGSKFLRNPILAMLKSVS